MSELYAYYVSSQIFDWVQFDMEDGDTIEVRLSSEAPTKGSCHSLHLPSERTLLQVLKVQKRAVCNFFNRLQL